MFIKAHLHIRYSKFALLLDLLFYTTTIITTYLFQVLLYENNSLHVTDNLCKQLLTIKAKSL